VKKTCHGFCRGIVPRRQDGKKMVSLRPQSPLRFDVGAARASAFYKDELQPDIIVHLISTVARKLSMLKSLYRDGKNSCHAFLITASGAKDRRGGLLHAGLQSKSIVFSLYCRAVIANEQLIN